MARHLRVPGIVDLLRVGDPAEIRDLAGRPQLDRRLSGPPRGPLVNRVLVGRIHRWLRVDGAPLPTVAPRGDAARAERQRELVAELDPAAADRQLWTEAQLDRLAAFVRGTTDRADAGQAAQEVCGRLFAPGYAADAASWRAAETLDGVGGAGPLRYARWVLTRRIRRARDLLAARAGGDAHAVHATGIAVHNIVRALEAMRALRAEGRGAVATDTALSRCLVAPPRVLRTVEAPLAVPGARGQLRPGALVVLELDAARQRAPDRDLVFMTDWWSACPAAAFVPALLGAVWERAAETETAADASARRAA